MSVAPVCGKIDCNKSVCERKFGWRGREKIVKGVRKMKNLIESTRYYKIIILIENMKRYFITICNSSNDLKLKLFLLVYLTF